MRKDKNERVTPVEVLIAIVITVSLIVALLVAIQMVRRARADDEKGAVAVVEDTFELVEISRLTSPSENTVDVAALLFRHRRTGACFLSTRVGTFDSNGALLQVDKELCEKTPVPR